MEKIKFEAMRVIGDCCICGDPIECFQYFYIIDNGNVIHDYCWESLEDPNSKL